MPDNTEQNTEEQDEQKQANPLYRIQMQIHKSAEAALKTMCESACENLKNNLSESGHVRTGELYDSINYKIQANGDKITAEISMNEYGKFIDPGTGAAHGVENGREGYWRYKDRNGQWHTTNGMDADPFIDKSVLSAFMNLPEELRKALSEAQQNTLQNGGGNS